MFVEVVGLPGAGKSSLIRGLIRKFRDTQQVETVKTLSALPARDPEMPRYIAAQPDRTILYRATRFRGDHPALMAHVDGLPLGTTDRFLYSLLTAHHQTVGEYGDTIDFAFIDEAFLHRGVEAHLSQTDPLQFRSYLDLIPVPAAVLHVRTRPRVAFRRAIQRRSDKPKAKDRVVAKLGDLERFQMRQALVEIGLDRLAGRGSHVIDIDATLPVKACVEQAADALSARAESAVA